jgi:hypothetical protein
VQWQKSRAIKVKCMDASQDSHFIQSYSRVLKGAIAYKPFSFKWTKLEFSSLQQNQTQIKQLQMVSSTINQQLKSC